MNFIGRLPTAYVKRPVETSPLNTPRDSSSGGQLWKKLRALSDQNQSATNFLRQVNRKLAKTSNTGPLNGRMHPFKIYTFPMQYLKFALTPGTEWKTFWVRAGSLFIDVASGTFLDADSNTDGVDQPYDDVFNTTADGALIDQSTVQYFTAANNDITYVWIEIDPTAIPVTGEVKWHISPTLNGWASWPAFDCKHILVGWVDTASQYSSRQAIVRQVLREDVCVF